MSNRRNIDFVLEENELIFRCDKDFKDKYDFSLQPWHIFCGFFPQECFDVGFIFR